MTHYTPGHGPAPCPPENRPRPPGQGEVVPRPPPLTSVASPGLAGSGRARHRRIMASVGGGRREPALASRLAPAARILRSADRRGPARHRIAWRGRVFDETGRGPGAGEEDSLAVGPGPPLVEPVQQPGDGLGVAAVAERGVDMIQQARPQAARIGGLPGERVDSWPGEPPPGRGGEGRVDPPGRHRRHWRPPAGLGQGGRDQGAGQPGQQPAVPTSRQASATRTSTVG